MNKENIRLKKEKELETLRTKIKMLPQDKKDKLKEILWRTEGPGARLGSLVMARAGCASRLPIVRRRHGAVHYVVPIAAYRGIDHAA